MRNLDIHSIEGMGKLDTECVWLEVKKDIPNLSEYLLCDATLTDNNQVFSELRHTYWFTARSVKQRDWVKLMTMTGTKTSMTNKRGTTTHVLYWGLDRTIWNKGGDCAILFHLNSWNVKGAYI
jgi:hypothetical protein